MENSLKYYIVQGVVQGVGYRQFVKTTAHNLDVRGWVRNLSTKEVELLAFTNLSTHNKLYEALSEGPPIAKVEKILQKEIFEKDISSKGFEILETKESRCYEL